MGTLLEMIKGRKSVRTYDGNVISEDHRKDIEEYIKDIPNREVRLKYGEMK